MGDKIAPNLRVLHILEIIADADGPMVPAEISRAMGLPKQTVHRLCATLEENGFLVRDADQKGLRPARRMRAISSGLLSGSHIHIARHQILQDLSRQVGETVNFVLAEENGMIYQDRVETDWPFRIQLPIGTHVPFHCTASGKTYLASLPPKKRSALVSSLSMEKLTENTIATEDALHAELKTVRRQGFALDDQEFVNGMVAIAAPVRDPRGKFFAAVAFHGPIQRLSLDYAKSCRDVLFQAAERLKATLFN